LVTTPEKPRSPSLQDLTARIDRLRTETGYRPDGKKADAEPTTGLGMAFAIASHMVAGLGVGGGLGYLLDRWLQTSPWLLILFFLLGAAAGFVNVYRTASRYGMAAGYQPAAGEEAAVKDNAKASAKERPGGKNDNEA
jgi:ATP synthase protein I